MLANLAVVVACLAAAAAEVVLVTGASSGIGYTTAKYLAARGMQVVLTARRTDKLEAAVAEIKAAGGEAMHVKLDVTSDEDHINAFAAAEAAYGGVDYVFINAGYEGNLAPLEVADTSEMQKIFDVNLMGMLRTIKYGLPYLKKRGGGSMVSVSSIAGTFHRDQAQAMGQDIFMPYAMSKAATDMIARVAIVYLKDNIRFYNVKPAVFDSEMTRRFPGDLNALAAFNPFFSGLPGDPITIARTVEAMFDGTTKWQPGQNVVVDGDGAWDAIHWYKSLEEDGGVPSAKYLKGFIKSTSGGDYTCTTTQTCQWYNGEKGPLAAKEEL